MSRESRDTAEVLRCVAEGLRERQPWRLDVDHSLFGGKITMVAHVKNNNELAAVQTLVLRDLVHVVGMSHGDATKLVGTLHWRQA